MVPIRQLVYLPPPLLAVALLLGGCAAPGGQGGTAPPAAQTQPAGQPVTAIDSTRDAGGETGLRPPFVDQPRKLNLNIYGLSYHPDRAGIHASRLDNEVNPGLGLSYEVHEDERGVVGLEGGFFKDSGRNWAKFAGASYQYKLGRHWRLGADLLAMQSQTYNHTRSFLAPIPRISYDFGAVRVNAIYVPQFGSYSRYSTFGFYFTTPIGTW
jgi:hypothetical protein